MKNWIDSVENEFFISVKWLLLSLIYFSELRKLIFDHSQFCKILVAFIWKNSEFQFISLEDAYDMRHDRLAPLGASSFEKATHNLELMKLLAPCWHLLYNLLSFFGFFLFDSFIFSVLLQNITISHVKISNATCQFNQLSYTAAFACIFSQFFEFLL